MDFSNDAWLGMRTTKLSDLKDLARALKRPHCPSWPRCPAWAGWARSRTVSQPNLAPGRPDDQLGSGRPREETPQVGDQIRNSSQSLPLLGRTLVPSPTPQAQRNAERPRPQPRGAHWCARWPWPPHLAIVADEHHAVAGVYRPGTEITLLNTHVECAWWTTTWTPLKGSDATLSREVILFWVSNSEEVSILASAGPWKAIRPWQRPRVATPAKTLSFG